MLGFIGVGTMGAPLASRLIEKKYSVLVYNRTQSKLAPVLAAGSTGSRAESIAAFADCEVVFTCLARPEHVEEICLGPDGLYAHLKASTVHVELSTIAPETALKLAHAASERGIAYVQCTVGKTPAHAGRGESPLFVGGEEEPIQKIWNILVHMGQPRRVGSVEASCAVKLISNLIGLTNVLVLAEGMRIGREAGMDGAQLLNILQDTGARSFQMDVRGPLMATGEYTPLFALNLAIKDVGLGCAMAEQWGLKPATMRAALETLQKADAQGLGQEDCAALLKIL